MAHDDHSAHHVNYLLVFFALCGFTALSCAFDIVGDTFSYEVLIVLVLAVAVAKALCVMMFFMHLKFEGNWKFVLLAPTTILAIGLPLALYPDVGAAYYTSTAVQQEWKPETDAYRAEHGEAGHGADATEHDHDEADQGSDAVEGAKPESGEHTE